MLPLKRVALRTRLREISEYSGPLSVAGYKTRLDWSDISDYDGAAILRFNLKTLLGAQISARQGGFSTLAGMNAELDHGWAEPARRSGGV